MILFKKYANKMLCLAGLLFGLFLLPKFVLAQATYQPLVSIPGIPSNAGVTVYLSGLYNFLISVVGIVAMGAIVIGGARYLTSVGNPSAIEDAKHTIWSAIWGLILAITSWVIVSTINPDILVLKNPTMGMPLGAYGGSVATRKCALPGGDPVISGCRCIDNTSTPVFGITPFPPLVIGTSIPTCSYNIPTSTTSVSITFSEAMDTSTLNNANITMVPAGVTVVPDPANSNAAIATFSPALAATTLYTITVGIGVKNAKGTAMNAPYVFKFTTDINPIAGCTKLLTSTACERVCSDPALASDSKYHGTHAEILVGSNINSITSDNITIKAGTRVYFDLSKSFDCLYYNNPLTPNGIYRYEMDMADPADAFANVGCSEYVTASPINFCTLLGFISPGYSLLFGDCPGTNYHDYATPGKYEVKASVYNIDCNCGSFFAAGCNNDTAIIDVVP